PGTGARRDRGSTSTTAEAHVRTTCACAGFASPASPTTGWSGCPGCSARSDRTVAAHRLIAAGSAGSPPFHLQSRDKRDYLGLDLSMAITSDRTITSV